MTITDSKMEAALHYLAESEQAYAEARGLAAWLDEEKGIRRSEAFKQAMAGSNVTVALAESLARTDAAYIATINKLRDAITAEALLRAKRERAMVTIELWRSINASRRQGNL